MTNARGATGDETLHAVRWLAALALLGLSCSACNDSIAPSTDAGGGGDSSLAVDARPSDDAGDGAVGPDRDSGPDLDGPKGPGLAGTLVDEDGAPLAMEPVYACTKTVCYTGTSGADGR